MKQYISIIIPHYNKNKTLLEVWDELMLQINPKDEILVVDDHSDKIPDFDCQCTKVIQPPKHTPHIWRLNTVRNYGLEHAKHDWCIILDPDCVPNKNFIKNARKMMDASILFTGRIDREREDGSIEIDPRNNSNLSYWCDLKDKNGAPIWGGVMMFSKSRTKLIDWFDEDYNGKWGCGETDFGAKCYHSGMRLRYSVELQVRHIYHKKNREGYKENRELWMLKTEQYRNYLGTFTSYNPPVGVMVITMLRPKIINQCLQSVFRNRYPVKIRLINNGDEGELTRRICKEWGRRWAVDYVYHPRKWPAVVRNDTMRWSQENKFKYLMSVDDDMMIPSNGVNLLIKVLEDHPQYYAVSGIQKNGIQGVSQYIGGIIQKTHRGYVFWNYPLIPGVHKVDWIGAGYTVHRVKPMVPYDESYKTGFNDYDWCMELRKRGLQVAVANTVAYHKHIMTSQGLKNYKTPNEYARIRYDVERHEKNNDLFKKKWGERILVRSQAMRDEFIFAGRPNIRG